MSDTLNQIESRALQAKRTKKKNVSTDMYVQDVLWLIQKVQQLTNG